MIDSVSLACWNVDGLFTKADGQRSCKLEDDFFQEMAKNFTIIGLVETHCGPEESRRRLQNISK